MSFNIWERWPWTSFQNLNLDWIMKTVKEAITKAEEASASVGQFDDRITANENAIEQLGIDVETITSTVRVFVNSQLEARYRGNLITGAELVSMIQTHGDLPFVEYNGEIYMLDTVSNAGDVRFSMGHTVTGFNDLVIRHIMIPAQSSNAAYSVTNVGGGSGSSEVMVVTITDSGSGYTMDSTYAAIVTQLNAGKAVIVRVQNTGTAGAYAVSGMIMKETATVEGQTMGVLRIIDPNMIRPSGAFNMYAWYIYENNTVGHGLIHENIATQAAVTAWVNDGDTNALLKTAQTLTAAQQAQVKQNIGITGEPLVVTVANPSSGNPNYTVDKTAAEIRANLYNLRLRYGLNEGVNLNSYAVYGSPPVHIIRFTETDPESNSANYVEFILTLYREGFLPQDPADDVVTVTRNLITHNIGGGSLPGTMSAAAGDFLRLDSNKTAVWQTVPAAESNSFGGV